MTGAISRLLVLLSVLWSTAAAQELTLRKDCEAGFRRFIQMVQSGALSAHVSNANVRVDGKRVEVELVRVNAPSTVLRLTPKQSAQTLSRYFDIIPADGTSMSDAERVGKALDAAFAEDPFTILGLEGSRGDDPIPGVLAAWGYGGWRGVARVLERRMMVLASVRYTVAVIVGLAIGLCAEIALALFDGAVRAHALAPEHRPLLLLAAQYFEHVRRHGMERPARTARDLVLAQPIEGLDAEAQSLVASIVAFQSERIKRDQELAFLRLSDRDKHSALQLSAILSLSEVLAANGAQVQVAPLLRDGTGETVITVAGERAAHAIEAAADRDWRWLEALGPVTIRPAVPEERLPPLPQIEHSRAISPAVPGMPGEQDFAESARRSLRRHFEKMLAREAEVRSGEDPEDVHQMRVATRRLRASLQVVAPVFDLDVIRGFRKKLRTAAAALGGVRDADVFLEHVRSFRETMRPARRASLDELITAVETERAGARMALLAELDAKRYQRFKHEFARFLTTHGDGVAARAEHGGPLRLRDLAGSLLLRRYEELRSFETIFPNPPDEQLHQMRISGKRLRYTLEFFAEALGEGVDACLNPLAELQEALGSLQDAAVARERIETMGMAKSPGPRAYLARRELERTRMLQRLPMRWAKLDHLTYRRKLFGLYSAL